LAFAGSIGPRRNRSSGRRRHGTLAAYRRVRARVRGLTASRMEAAASVIQKRNAELK
jgi:hypothetical protein